METHSAGENNNHCGAASEGAWCELTMYCRRLSIMCMFRNPKEGVNITVEAHNVRDIVFGTLKGVAPW